MTPTPNCAWSTSCATGASRSSCRSRGRPTRHPSELRQAFEGEHEERYGYRDSEQQLELVTIRVTATAEGAEVELASPGEDRDELERSSRKATLGGEPIELEVLRGIPRPGTQIDGAAVIELPEATLLIPPGWVAEVDDTGTTILTRRCS